MTTVHKTVYATHSYLYKNTPVTESLELRLLTVWMDEWLLRIYIAPVKQVFRGAIRRATTICTTAALRFFNSLLWVAQFNSNTAMVHVIKLMLRLLVRVCAGVISLRRHVDRRCTVKGHTRTASICAEITRRCSCNRPRTLQHIARSVVLFVL